jgi:hypothetical protein
VMAILDAARRSGLRFVDLGGEARLVHTTHVHFAQLVRHDGVKVLWNFSATKDHQKAHTVRQPEIRQLNKMIRHFEDTLDSRSAENNQAMAAGLAIFKKNLEIEVVRKVCFLLCVCVSVQAPELTVFFV